MKYDRKLPHAGCRASPTGGSLELEISFFSSNIQIDNVSRQFVHSQTAQQRRSTVTIGHQVKKRVNCVKLKKMHDIFAHIFFTTQETLTLSYRGKSKNKICFFSPFGFLLQYLVGSYNGYKFIKQHFITYHTYSLQKTKQLVTNS